MASLIIDGKRREVPVAEEESILDAALRAGMDLPFACKGGMCSTCRAKLVEGDAQMEVNYSLEPWELKAGFILTCQARPCSDKVVVDYDHVVIVIPGREANPESGDSGSGPSDHPGMTDWVKSRDR